MNAPPPNPDLAAALAALQPLEPARVDEVWIFAPRLQGERESGLAVLSLLDGEPAERRRQIVTLRYELRPLSPQSRRRQRVDEVAEQGSCPAERVPRLIDGVLRRLGAAGGGEEPIVEQVRGDPLRWAALLQRLGGALDPAS